MYNRYKRYITGVRRSKKLENLVESFIRRKALIVYGGLAIDRVIRHKTSNSDSLYNLEIKMADFDVFSLNYNDDSTEFAELLSQFYSYVRVITGITGFTRKVWANFSPEAILDVTHIDADKLQCLNPIDIDGILYADPQFLKIDQYQNLCMNLFSDSNRIEAALKKIQLLERHFPIISDHVNQNSVNEAETREFSVTEEYVIGGDYVYSLYYDEEPIGDKFYYSNDFIDEVIPPTGFRHENMLLLPMIGETWYTLFGEERVVPKITLLYTYYYLRFYECTQKYDMKIQMLANDPETFRFFIEDVPKPQIFVPTPIKRKRAERLQTIWL